MPNIIETDWVRLLQAWMHDPVDKALSIPDHGSRARRHLSIALGESVAAGQNKSIGSADINASIADRLPMPSPGPYLERAVGPQDGPIQVYHPVSAQKQQLTEYELDETAVSEVIAGIVSELPNDPKIRFFALWRLLPNALYERFGFDFTRLPADTRVPDHSLIQHADATSGIFAAQQGRDGYGILSVTLGPVQTFIQAARSVRDLWSGSAMLSWLIFQGIRPVIENLGPTVLVFPSLRGHPLVDMWLRSIPDLSNSIPEPSRDARMAPSLPNRFVALVPYGPDGETASAFAKDCEIHIRAGWKKLSDSIRDLLDDEFATLFPNWSQNWDTQVKSFFDISTSICPARQLNDSEMANLIGGTRDFSEVWRDAHRIRQMLKPMPPSDIPKYSQDQAGAWQAQLEVSTRIAEARRTIRHVPTVSMAQPADPKRNFLSYLLPNRRSIETPNEPAGPKCSLLGTYEQVGPSVLQESSDFWAAVWNKNDQLNDQLREPDRFCAITLCKRFAAKHVLADEFNLNAIDLRFPDTATIAAADWLHHAGIDPKENQLWNGQLWNGRWIHQKRADEDGERVPSNLWSRIKQAKRTSPPPSYYAILVMDADDMGLWLKGEKAPRVREIIHEKLLEYFEKFKSDGLNAKRPVGPALHASISDALNNFASFVVPHIVNHFRGTLIYSGGDDVLALLPARRAVQCAMELEKAFTGRNDHSQGWTKIDGQRFLTMGHKATLSAGIAFVHYKEDLRLALRAARKAEKISKNAPGKNRLTLQFMRRSGNQPSCILPWHLGEWFQEAIDIFADGVSDRWAYLLRSEKSVLSDPGLPPEAVEAEINRLINRSDVDQKLIGHWWSRFYTATDDGDDQDRLDRFIELCLGASFVARGYDG